MDHILFTRLIRFSWCLGIALIILPSLQAEPDLRLVAVYGKKEYPVKSIRPDEIEIEMPNGQIKALRRGFFFRLKGTAKPSLNIGYAPALYEISRAPTNHYFAGRRKAPDTYTLILSGRTKADNDPWWVETDLSKIWKPSALNPKKGILLLAWWNQKWERVRLTKVRGGRFDYNGDFRSRHLPGHPVILLWKNGRFIPPSVYQEAVAGSPFETIQKGDAGPALFDPKAKDPLGLSPAHYLASWGHTDAFASQPKNALKKVRWSRKHPTPLMLAAMHGHVATTESLIELGLSPTREMPGMGFDAGHLAILAGHSEVISAFIERGYSRRNETNDGIYNPVTLAIDTRRDDIVGLFDATRRDLPSFRRENSQRLLFREASFGHTHSLRLLVEAGAMPNELINDRSALFFAAGSGNAASVEVLLQLGADPNPQIKVSPLQIATAVGNYDSVHALLEAGADPNPPGEVSPLSNAVKAGDTQMVRALLEAGADPNPLRPGRTFGLAEIATVVDQADIVADLFAAGAVCRLDPEQAEFVLSHAISNDIVEMAMLALDQCVAPDHTLFGEYPITWVAEYFEAEAVRQWLTTAPLASETARPVFSPAKNLDASLERIAGSMIPLPEGMFKRFGRMETKIHLIIDEEGHARFPKVDKSLPAMLRLLVYEMIAQWRFTPPTEQGKPVKTQAVLPLVFDRPPGDTTALEMRELTTPPEAITQDDPIYPPALRRNRVGGDVLVEFIIRKDGRADFVKAIRTRVTEY